MTTQKKASIEECTSNLIVVVHKKNVITVGRLVRSDVVEEYIKDSQWRPDRHDTLRHKFRNGDFAKKNP